MGERILKRLISLTLAILIIMSGSILSFAEIIRNETVFVNLDYEGNTKTIKVITHLSGTSSHEYHIEYGDLENLLSLTDGVSPIIEKGLTKWPTKDIENADVYYEGNIDKGLPLKLDIKYYLDGEEVQGQDLAGKTGQVKIGIKVMDSKDLTTQIQIPFNLDIFKNFETEKGVISVVGKTMTVVFTHLPMGDEEYTIVADGKEIELDPITIVATDSSSLFKDSLSGIDELVDGIKKMSKASQEMKDGSNQLSDGMDKLKDGLSKLSSGIGEFLGGIKEIGTNLLTLVSVFKEINLGFKALNENTGQMVGSIGQMNEGLKMISQEGNKVEGSIGQINMGLKELNGGLAGLSQGLGALGQGHKDLSNLAKTLLDSQDPRVQALVQGVIEEDKALDQLSLAMGGLSEGMDKLSQGADSLHKGYEDYNGGLSYIANNFNQLNEGIKTFPEEINKMYEGNNQLVEGLIRLNGGMEDIVRGSGDLERNVKGIPSEVQKIIDGQDELTKGLDELNEKGFKELISQVEDFTNPDEEETFTSFVDSKNKINSNVQILMQTPPIKVAKEKIEIQEEVVIKKTIFQRFLDLFKFLK